MEPILEAKSLNLWYGQNHALHDVSIAIPERQITAFIGPSGCGKSTFLRTLNRMNDLIPSVKIQGQVDFHGKNIYDAGVDPTLLRKRIGMVFQKANPFPMSIYDNVAYGPRLPAQHIAQQLRTHHSQRCHPQGEVDPVVPGGPGAPSGVGPRRVDPVVQAAVPGEGGAQLRGDQPIGQQKRQDHEQPPEILAVADGGHRGGGLRHEHHAYDGQHHVRQAEFAFLHVSSGPGPP